VATVGGVPVLEQDPDINVEWVSWEGRPPEQPFAGFSDERKREMYEQVQKPLADKYGVPIRVAGPDYRTTNAHLATFYARDKGDYKSFRNRIYRARWVENLDLESPEVLARLGAEEGLDGEKIKKVIAEKRYLGSLHSQRAQGKAAGIYGIPSFIVEGKIFWGADVIDDVQAAVARVREARLKEKEE